MPSAEKALWLLEDRRHGHTGTTMRAPSSFSTLPPTYEPHPPLVVGPGRYPMSHPVDKTPGAALLFTSILGPLGLCYLSVTTGIAATALTVGLLVASGSAVVLAVIWPVAMLLALIYATDQR